jgi:Bacterial CdiA-CT RNAse A domain
VRTLALLVALFTSLPIASVHAQGPRRDLAADERCGGHTVARHVGKTNQELADRLRQQPQISAASTYTDLPTAETVVGAALARESSRIETWSARRGSRPNLALRYTTPGPRPIGRSWRRGRSAPDGCFQAVVVLRWQVTRDAFCVLTSYPEVAR